MGSVGLSFPITPGLDAVWGYEPSIEGMRSLIADCFAYDRSIATDDLVRLRYEASVQPGFQESYGSMFPAPRQRGVDDLATPEAQIAALPMPALLMHGREDRVIPMDVSLRLFGLIPNAELHLFGHCGHWTQIERRAEFTALVMDFLAR
jgi:pimeloyl-ACP methyl ester carboxylesterase